MINFKEFAEAIENQFNKMQREGTLFEADVDPDKLWEHYLESFPPGTNPIFRERREHDCSACRNFIKHLGATVILDNNLRPITIWDVEAEFPYDKVAKAMADYVKQYPIKTILAKKEPAYGCKKNYDTEDSLVWYHFYHKLPASLVGSNHASRKGKAITNKNVFKRSLDEITLDAIDALLDLIRDNNLYRGDQYLEALKEFKKHKTAYLKVPDGLKDNFCWVNSMKSAIPGIRNTSIGTLLVSLSEGKPLEDAVRAYEKIVAPGNYRRPKPIITKSMIKQAKDTIKKLGYEDSLARRYANKDDINVNDVLYVDRPTFSDSPLDVFDVLEMTAITKRPSGQPIEVTDFMKHVLPTATKLEMFFDPMKHKNNLVSLITAANPEAPSLFSWDNPFSWTYNGDLADSIKQKVKAAGGKVSGYLRASLNWFNVDDLDLHAKIKLDSETEVDRYIYFGHKYDSYTGGELDVDMNVNSTTAREDAVENIIWPSYGKIKPGLYSIEVHNYTKRKSYKPGFVVEIEFDGNIYTYHYDKPVRANQYVKVVDLQVHNDKSITIKRNYIEPGITNKEVWGLHGGAFHQVNLATLSPNCWGASQKGQKHYFFFLEGCKNPDDARGFYNEFLKAELHKHRKVFEVLAEKLRAPYTDDQLSGLGFSSTIRNEVVVRVDGNKIYTIKI